MINTANYRNSTLDMFPCKRWHYFQVKATPHQCPRGSRIKVCCSCFIFLLCLLHRMSFLILYHSKSVVFYVVQRVCVTCWGRTRIFGTVTVIQASVHVCQTWLVCAVMHVLPTTGRLHRDSAASTVVATSPGLSPLSAMRSVLGICLNKSKLRTEKEHKSWIISSRPQNHIC